jgi:hypothetical protein
VNKQKSVILLIVIAVMAMPFASCGQLAGPKGEITITKLNKPGDMGPVKFIHDKHETKQVKCIVCHHKVNNDDRIKICGTENCHTGQGAEETIHNLCINCHKEKGKKAPTECDACHKK